MRHGMNSNGSEQADVIVRLPNAAVIIAAAIIMPILTGAGAIGAA